VLYVTRQNFHVFLLIIIVIISAGCSQKSEHQALTFSYEEFKDKYLEIKTQFSPKNFINISPQDLVVRTTSFPEQKIDDNQIDALNNDVQCPLRYENYYKSNNSGLLVKVNLIYQPEIKNPSFNTINSINQLDNPNILDQYSDLKRPLFDEYIISQTGFLVVLNFLDISNEFDEDYDLKYKKFNEEQLDFYGQFEDILLSVI